MTRIDGTLYPSADELRLYKFYRTLGTARVALWCHTCDRTIITDMPPDALWARDLAVGHQGHRIEAVTEILEYLAQGKVEA